MLANSRAIVLSAQRYSDSSVIARLYTESAGQRAFLMRTGSGRGGAGKAALLHPLALLHVSFPHDDRPGLRTLRHAERAIPLPSLPFDVVKSSIALFISEVLSRVLQEESPDPALFGFLHGAVSLLDAEQAPCHNFHIQFLVELSRYLGCRPSASGNGLPHFDLIAGEFCDRLPSHPHTLSGEAKAALADVLCNEGLSAHAGLRMSNQCRRELLRGLVAYLRLHLEGMREVRSHEVLEEVLG